MRDLPHNLEAEQALLAALLVKNRVYDSVGDILSPQHFYLGVHGRIFAAIGQLIGRGSGADPVTLKGLFQNDEALQAHGGAEYLTRLAGSVVSFVNAESYAQTIRDLALRRAMIDLGERLIEESQQVDLDRSAEKIADEIEGAMFALREDGEAERTRPQPLVAFANQALKEADERRKRGAGGGVKTGFLDLDAILGSLFASDYVLLGGRPSMGKTALATCIGVNAAAAGHPVGLWSLEMSGVQVGQRVLAAKAQISSQNFRTGDLTDDDFMRGVAASDDVLAKLPIQIDETGGISLAQLRARARRFMRAARAMPGAGRDATGEPLTPLIIVDYIQLMAAEGRRQDNRTEDVSALSRGLKTLAKELMVPILALSQLSRQVEGRENKRPMLSDLRESGSLEQDADTVMFVYREEYYLTRDDPKQGTTEKQESFNRRYEDQLARLDACRNQAEIVVAKQRMGPTGTARLHFDAQTTWFSNLAKGE